MPARHDLWYDRIISDLGDIPLDRPSGTRSEMNDSRIKVLLIDDDAEDAR